MDLLLYNTLTRSREIFKPIKNNLVTMYVCGPTVYDRPHIGNARSVVVYDILYRILIHLYGHKNVNYVRNITDVDDKIIDRARELNVKIHELTLETTTHFHHDMEYLNCLTPNIEPKATEHIHEMIVIIQRLIDQSHAYVADKHVYFDVSSAQNYTELSGRNINEMFDGVRIDNSESKKHPEDFVLWKPSHTSDDSSANFDSPWGRGRPGWHIECSAMSHKYLGENFDIHGGGADLIFPHHTNEIAQSKSAFPESNFAKYWIHNGFLTCNGEKMSKSLGNFIIVKDLINQKIHGEIARLFLLSSHYRKPLDYNEKAINDATKMTNYWYRAIEGVDIDQTKLGNLPEDFVTSLLDDMNTPLAIKIINDYAKSAHASTNSKEKLLHSTRLLSCARFIGLMKKSWAEWFTLKVNQKTIAYLIEQRQQAKKEKNWALADQIRQDLLKQGVKLEDKADGTTIIRSN